QIWDWHSFHKEISTDLPNVGCAGMDCSSILISCSPSCSATCFDLSIIAMLAFVWSCCCFIAMDKAAMSIVTLLTLIETSITQNYPIYLACFFICSLKYILYNQPIFVFYLSTLRGSYQNDH